MNLLDDKYNKSYSYYDCDCGEENSFIKYNIKDLLHNVECSHCGQGYLINDTTSENTQGLHPATVELYNKVIEETSNYNHGRMTLRHLFYRLVSNGTIEKTEKHYEKLLKDVGNMRKTGIIKYTVFADGSRLFRRPKTYDGLEEALQEVKTYYRKSLWSNSPVYVEFWVEKHAISDIIYEVTSQYDVPLAIAKGFSSLTFIHDAAEYIINKGKPAFIYHIGDHDPSGIAAAKSIEETFLKFEAPIFFKRLCVTKQQIKTYSLMTRPTKESTHSKNFEGESVEVDAMEPLLIQQLVKDAIMNHIDIEELQRLKHIEQAEKNTLNDYMQNFRG
jgi:hypothetical protein